MLFENYNDLIKSITNEHELIGVLPIAKLDFSARNRNRFFIKFIKALSTGIIILLASIIAEIIPGELGMGIVPILVVWIFWKPKQAEIDAIALIINKRDLKLVQITLESTGFSIYHSYDIEYAGKKIKDVINLSIVSNDKLNPDLWIKLDRYSVKASIDFYRDNISIKKFKYRVLGEEDLVEMVKV